MRKNAHFFTTCSASRTCHAACAPNVANALRATIAQDRLNDFIAQRERSAGHLAGAEEVVAFVDTFARTEGPESACELLDLAAKFGDYNIINYEIYKELIATSGDT
jgi:hypothetical protein